MLKKARTQAVKWTTEGTGNEAEALSVYCDVRHTSVARNMQGPEESREDREIVGRILQGKLSILKRAFIPKGISEARWHRGSFRPAGKRVQKIRQARRSEFSTRP